jgi:hypothetical protein
LLLLLGNYALYHPAARLGFLSVDDPDYVQNNPNIEHVDAAKLKSIFTKPCSANYAPANILSYALDVALAGGKDAGAIHLSSVWWHGWVVFNVYLLAFAIRKDLLLAAGGALLFLAHPAHVEVVAWISSRKDLVATGFAALAMTCYVRYAGTDRGEAEPSGKRPWWPAAGWLAGTWLSFVVASAGKQSVLLLPGVMLAWDVLVAKRRTWRMFADKVPFGLATLFFGWMTYEAQPSTNQAHNLFVMAATELKNLWLLTGLGQYVVYRNAPNPAAWNVGVKVLVIATAVAVWGLPLLFFFTRRHRPPAASSPTLSGPSDTTQRQSGGQSEEASRGNGVRVVLCYWVLINMAPPMVLSFLIPITDRYLFLPSVGSCILVADILVGWARGTSQAAHWLRLAKPAWITVPLLVALVAASGAKTWNYLAEWGDPRSVWYGARLKTNNSQVQQFLGEIYQNAGERVDGFIRSGKLTDATNDLALARAVLGGGPRFDQLCGEWTGAAPTRTNSLAYRDGLWAFAWQRYEESLARRGNLSTPNLFMNRGRLLVSEGKFPQAIKEFQTALAFGRTSTYDVVQQEIATHAQFAIGVAHWHEGNYREAEQWLLKAQAAQRKSGQLWVPDLDAQVERVKALARGQGAAAPGQK